MADDFGFQLSVNLPSGEQYEKGDMVNIRGGDAGEFLRNVLAMDADMSEQVANAAQALRAKYLLVRSLGAQTVTQERTAPPSAPQQPQNAPQEAYSQPQGNYPQQQGYGPQNGAQQPQQGYGQQGGYQQQQGNGVPTSPPPNVGPAPECSHGVKRFLAKPYRNGKPGYWMAWACPAQKGDPTQHELQFIGR